MRFSFLICLIVVSLTNCASTVRQQFTDGEDDENKVVRVIVSPGLAVTTVNGKKPAGTFDLNNHVKGGLNKIFNLFPGKHTLEISFKNPKVQSWISQPLTFEAKAKQVVFLCYDVNYEKETWKPRALIPSPEKIETENVMGIFNIYLKESSDREDCFVKY